MCEIVRSPRRPAKAAKAREGMREVIVKSYVGCVGYPLRLGFSSCARPVLNLINSRSSECSVTHGGMGRVEVVRLARIGDLDSK